MKRPVLVLILLLTAVAAFAQTESARMSGRVTDSTGAVIVGAQCTITNIETNGSATTATNSDGIYVFPELRPAMYRLIIQKDGFHTVVKPGLELHVQDAIDENFTLAVGSTSESITVTGGAPVLDTQSAAVSTVVDSQFVENMPLNGRSFQSLIAMVPGINFTAGDAYSPGQFSVNGQRTSANYFMVDGVSANFGSGGSDTMGTTLSGGSPGWTVAGGTNGLVSVDAMQEFRIQTSTFAPEFGRTPGGQISIVTKSGTNQFHGTAFDYLRNDVFDARNWFDFAEPNSFFGNTTALPKAALRQNDFGGTVGGPIWKNKTFFFFSYEGLRLRQPQTELGTFLTAAARANVAPVWQPWVNAEPIPSPTAPPIGPCDNITVACQASMPLAYSLPSTLNATSLRIDHTLTSRITLFARYNHAPSNAVAGAGNSENFTHSFSNVDTATLGATFVLSPTKTNDIRGNWSRNVGKTSEYAQNLYGGVVPPDSVLYPAGFSAANTQIYAYSSDYSFTFGPRVGQFSDNVQRQINIVDNFSWVKGKHQLKFGVDWRRLKPSPSFTPNSIGLYADYASLVAGNLDFCYCSRGGVNTIIFNNYSLYAQDTFKATNRLTLTYGLRWDVNPPPSPATSEPIYVMQGIFDSKPLGIAPAGTPAWYTKYANFAPRIGAAYQLTPKTVVRGGFGIFYDTGVSENLAGAFSSFPYSNAVMTAPLVPFSYSQPSFFQGPPFSLTPAPGDFATATSYDPNLKLPRTYQWNAAVQRELGKNQSLTVTYVGSKGQDLLRGDSIVINDPTYAWNGALLTRNADWSRYNSLQLQFQRRMSHGLQAMLSYTLAKSMDTASNDVGGLDATSVSALPNPGIDYGPSDFDIRNNFTAAVSYELPAPAWGKVGHALVKGWAVDGVVIARGGLPIGLNVYSSMLGGTAQYIRPDLVPGQPLWINNPNVAGGKYVNLNAFTSPPPGREGDFPRGGLRDFGMDQTDLALRRRFDITERVKLDFRAEYFNLFNHPMFAIGPSIYPAFQSGQATVTLNEYFGGITGGGYATGGNAQAPQYAMGGPRSGQLTLKIIF